ncbi:Putative outer membrane lipoprotein carrier protein [Rhodobacteraceae bacterium HTCC2150]|nr:Putative outer membrane lipoprotein carrier protein [Rhodobacteraceae bacterium HTCC2150]
MKHILKMALIPALTLGLAATSAMAEKIPLSDISAYFNDLKRAQTEFTQINADGTISTGTLYLHRPGRIRFEYNPPEESLVIAGGSQVAIFDAKSNTPPEQFPLKRTPLNIILERNVNLTNSKMVVGHQDGGNSTTVIAQDPEHPDYGSIELVFTADPVELRQWVINDGGGSQTTVILGLMERKEKLPASLFSIVVETAKRNK